jgi:hypothetical protein
MEGHELTDILCPDRCSCFDERATDFSMPSLRSHMEGRTLMGSLCLDRCACFHAHTTNFSMPTLCSEMEEHALLAIPNMYIRSARD